MNKEDTLKQICKMIASGEIPDEVYNKYLPTPPSILIGFRNEAEKQAFLLYAKKNNIEINNWKFTK